MSDVAGAPAVVLRVRDFIGREVVDRAGAKVGTVADFLIDRAGRIRFLDVEYGFPRRHVLLEERRLEWGENSFVAGWTADEVKLFPPYDPTRPLEAGLVAELESAYPWAYAAGDEWRAPLPDEMRIIPLAEARDFKLEPGAPDLRGWNVFGADGERAGRVADLLVDPAALKVRYLVVDVLDDLFLLKDDRRALVPLEMVDLKERGNDVWVRGLGALEIARLPAYTGGAVHPATARAVDAAFARPATGGDTVYVGPGEES